MLIRFILFITIMVSCTSQKKTLREHEDVKIPQVAVEKLKLQEIFETLEFAGTLAPVKSQNIYAAMTGLIGEKFVELGSAVNKGQALFTIKPAGDGQQYLDHRVLAPVSGYLTAIEVRKGEKIEKQGQLATISDLSSLSTTVQAGYDDLQHLKVSREVQVIVGPMSEKEHVFEGRVVAVAPQVSATSMSVPVKISFQCKESSCTHWQLGMLTKVVLKKEPKRGFLISSRNLHHGATEVLLIDKERKTSWVKVKTGKYYGEQIEVLSGLNEGMEIVTSFSREPKAGEEVVVVKDEIAEGVK
jgi:multidrug efflux pump subunit AcrA (membrane-fusion protein)